MDTIREQLREILEDILDQEIEELRDDMTAEDFFDWDSLAHLNIIVTAEKAFQVRFAAAEISRLKNPDQNVGSFLRLINEKKGNT